MNMKLYFALTGMLSSLGLAIFQNIIFLFVIGFAFGFIIGVELWE